MQRAKAGVEGLLRSAGPPMEAFRLAGKNPTERAKALWASLRARETNSIDVLTVWLAVDARIADDPQPDRHKEYRHVQVAKLIHRMAGGTHRRWEHERADRSVMVTNIHKAVDEFCA